MRNVVFDLDGTLVDSRHTIHLSLNHALRDVQRPEVSFETTKGLIGAPLLDIFSAHLGMERPDADRAINSYREHYAALGLEGTEVYESAAETLQSLKDRGHDLYVATVKAGPVAERVLAQLGFLPLFDGVVGSSMDSSRKDKVDIIEHVLNSWQLNAAESVMVGDRYHDMQGARHHGMGAIGVSYGYGTEQELRETGADRIIGHLRELPDCVAGWNLEG